MNVSLYQAASALTANSRWQDLVSQNLASSAIPGFKKQELSFAAVEAGMMSANSPGIRQMSMPQATAFTNFQQGELSPTPSNTDFALDGPGFFEVQLPNGASAYTRNGQFKLSPQGQLVTHQGYPVLGDGGPIQKDVNNPSPLTVSPDGEVSQGADIKGRMKLANFNNPRLLTQVEGGLFLATDPQIRPIPASAASVRQNWLEGSNTVSANEMANLMSGMRTFEANQRVIQIQDDRLGKAISQIAGT